MIDDDAHERVLDRLIEALAAQVDIAGSRTLAPGAVAALGDLSRAEASLIFGAAGHRVHYDADTEPIATLIRLVSDAQRCAAGADAVIRPGDEVHLASGLLPDPASNATSGSEEVTYVVRYVGDDGTVDVQPELTMDYVIETVPAAAVRPKADGRPMPSQTVIDDSVAWPTGAADGPG
ncbi:MAG TPA: hypothetical protein VF755_20585 [Catenuloplanes sp.]